MLIHGDQDLIVHVDQSRKMYKAMQKNNKNIEYIELENGNHHMSIEDNRLKVLSSLERFFYTLIFRLLKTSFLEASIC